MRFLQFFSFSFFLFLIPNLEAQEYDYSEYYYENENYDEYSDDYREESYTEEYYEEDPYTDQYEEDYTEEYVEENYEEYEDEYTKEYTSTNNEEDIEAENLEESESEAEHCNGFPLIATVEVIGWEDGSGISEMIDQECEAYGYTDTDTIDLCFAFINRFPLVSFEDDGIITYEHGTYFCSQEYQEEIEENLDDLIELVGGANIDEYIDYL